MNYFSESRKFLLSAIIVMVGVCGNLGAQKSHLITVEDPVPVLVPETEYAQKIKHAVFGEVNEKTGFALEKLYVIKKSELTENSEQKKVNPDYEADVSMKAVETIMRSVSRMKGMQYYSNTRKRYEVLYLDCYRVKGPDDKKRLPDLLEGDTDGLTIYTLQEDKSMGKNVYRVDFSMNSSQIVMLMSNLEDIYYGPIKAIGKGKLKVVTSVLDKGDSFEVYIAMCGEFPKIAMIEKKMNRSLEARLEAVYKWMLVQF